MDPLSVSLAVISVMTAVKDFVELGQKIHESFAKVSGNYRKAESVAQDVKEMVNEIKEFCEVHKKELDNMNDFCLALFGLLDELRNFERSILPLLPKTGGTKRDRLTRAWNVWRNSNRIEEGILDVQSKVVKIMRRYMWKSTMRAEIELGKVHQETSQGLEVLEAVRRDVSVIRVTTAVNLNSAARGLYESLASGSNDINNQIIKFAQSTSSTSAPMLQMADVIPEEIMTAAFIKQQVVHLVKILTKMPKPGPTTPNDINDPFEVNPAWGSMNIIDTQHSVLRLVLDLREMVKRGSVQTFPTMGAVKALSDLSVQINGLPHMHEEAIEVGAWATTLVRPLIDSNVGGADTRAELCLSLYTQSWPYNAIGDEIQSSQLITEAFSIASDLRNQFDGESRFRILYNVVLADYTRLVDTQTSIDLLNGALQALGDSFSSRVQGVSQLQLPHNLNTDAAHQFVIGGLLSSLSIPEMVACAKTLIQLAACYSKDGQSQSALGLLLVAITVYRHSVSTQEYNGAKGVLAQLLLWVVKNEEARDHIAIELLIDLANECIQLYRELAECNPELFARQLINILEEKALIQQSVKPDTRETLVIWEEIASLARDVVGNSRLQAVALHHLARQFHHLEMYEDAVRTLTLSITVYQYDPKAQASRYRKLSKYLRKLGRYKEATEASQKSVALHRHMALKDPGVTNLGALAESLSDLAYCLAASGDSIEALMTWREFTSMLDNLLNTYPDASSASNGNYLAALRKHWTITTALDNEEGSLMVSSTAARYYHRLSEMCCPHNFSITMDVLHADFSYVYHLLRFGHLQDAQQYIEDWADRWRERIEGTSDWDVMIQHTTMVGLKSKVLNAQGRTREALMVNQQAYNIIRPFIDSHYVSHLGSIDPMLYGAQLQVHLGNGNQALQVAETALQLARDDCLQLTDSTPVWFLHGVTSAALFCRNYKRASELALEGCKICATSSWQDKEDEFDALLRPSLLALLSSAEANLGRFSTAVEYANRAIEASLDIRKKRSCISATTAEQSYMETRGNLAEILIVAGDLEEARQICEERRAYFFKRVDTRMGEYRDLVPILRILGILCCSEGRHGEGNDAAQELVKIMNTLRSVFLSLQEQVKIQLRHQTQVPILKVLNDMGRKLDCRHQAEVASMFEV